MTWSPTNWQPPGVMGLRSARDRMLRDVSGGEPADNLCVIEVGDAPEVLGKPLLEHADLLVDDKQQAAGHEQVS
ncbi:hypothetical protein [Amycolatopsis sp. NPDC051071]|uniref:hypothetical protein n=1 Tax=Amycolatopsis sp. NPDC051071 TaxID=3154637 RepID=UPI003447DD5A